MAEPQAQPEKKDEHAHTHAHHQHHHSSHSDHSGHHHHVSHSPAVLITGANSGIGLATAVAFAAAGWNVYAGVRDLAKASDLVKAAQAASVSRHVHVVTVDVTHSHSVDDAVKYVFGREGRIDALINNAGVGVGGPLEGTTDEDVQRIFATNVFGVISAARSVVPYMRARGKGVIINISSSLSMWTWPLATLYCSTKFAVDGFTSAFGKEVAAFGIRVVTVHPHVTKSSFGENIKPGGRPFPTEIYDSVNSEHMKKLQAVLGGALDADTVAKACLQAATDEDKSRSHYYTDPLTEERAGTILKDPRGDRPTLY